MLNLLDANDLLATDNAIAWLVGGPDPKMRGQVTAYIRKLSDDTKVLHYRGLGGGYCLWPHTSVDIDGLFKKARATLGRVSRVSKELPAYLDSRPIVARRHYIETGNLRHFDVRYCNVDEITQHMAADDCNADGLVLVPLPDTAQEVSPGTSKPATCGRFKTSHFWCE
jgi:hypothetical protein